MKWRVKPNTRHFTFAKWQVLGFTHHFILYCINLTIFLHFCTFQQCISCEIGNLSMMFYSSSHSSTTRDFWWVKHHTEIASSQDIYNTSAPLKKNWDLPLSLLLNLFLNRCYRLYKKWCANFGIRVWIHREWSFSVSSKITNVPLFLRYVIKCFKGGKTQIS